MKVKKLKSTISIPAFKNIEDLKTIGNCLAVYTNKENNIENIELNLDGIILISEKKIMQKSSLLRKGSTDNSIRVDGSYTFVHIKSNFDYVLAIKQLNSNSIEILKYSLSGILVSRTVDDFCPNYIIRKKGKEKIFINDNNEVTKSIVNIKLDKIGKYKLKYDYWYANPNIGVIDTETYLSNDNVQKIYALGLKTVLSEKCYTYYIGKDLDSNKIVLEMIDELLKSKYSKIKFYCHNLAGYDIVFFLKILNEYNQNNDDKYDLSTIFRDDVIIKVTIKKGDNKLEIGDSYCILTNSLANLGKDFEVEVKKIIFSL